MTVLGVGVLEATSCETRGSPRLKELEDNIRRLKRVTWTRLTRPETQA